MPNIEKKNTEEQEKIEVNQAQLQPLSLGQKLAVAFLAFFGFGIFIFWSIDLKQKISSPFDTGPGIDSTSQTKQPVDTCEGPECNASELLNRDSDKDGLNDWEELNVYQTSPYLEDTDSDGFSDKQEIDSENDPNCPSGQDCYGQDLSEDEVVEKPIQEKENVNMPDLEALNQLNAGQNSSSNSEEEQKYQEILSGQGDAASLRQILTEAGMDKALLDQLSDEDIMDVYKETLNSQ